MRKPRRGFLAAGLVAAFALAACVLEDGPSTETGNPAMAGILRDASGLPAAGALVRLYRIEPSTDTGPVADPSFLDSLRTGADGAYRFDSLQGGATYALEGSDAPRAAFAFLPAAEIPAGAGKFLRRDTLVLKRPGRVQGIARRDSNPRPADVTGEAGILVRVVGLDRATYTDSAGRYLFPDIPEGVYTFHYMAGDGHYLGEAAGPVPVGSGAEVEMPPVVLDWSPFVAPPAPGGFTALPDSAAAAAVIRLSWNRVFVSNFDHYRILRSDSLSAAPPDTFRTRDTVFVDTVKHLPAGRLLQYRVQAVNTLGNASGNPVPRPVPVPAPTPGGTDSGNLEVSALVLSGGVPARALVRLYALSDVPDLTDRLPSGITLVDSARSGADGRVRFAGRPAGRHTLTASAETGGTGVFAAARVGVSSRRGGAADTLALAAPGTLQGRVSRGGLWCTSDMKLNQNIQVSLAGTPWFDVTDSEGSYDIPEVPAGDYRVLLVAVPKGCLLPDTLATAILPGRTLVLPLVTARPDPDFIPMITDLRLFRAAGSKVVLEWSPVPPAAYPRLQGYEVVRRDSAGAVIASSGLVSDPTWTDDFSGLPSKSVVNYLVRVVRDDGTRGRFGGIGSGPVYFTVP